MGNVEERGERRCCGGDGVAAVCCDGGLGGRGESELVTRDPGVGVYAPLIRAVNAVIKECIGDLNFY